MWGRSGSPFVSKDLPHLRILSYSPARPPAPLSPPPEESDYPIPLHRPLLDGIAGISSLEHLELSDIG